MQNNDDYVKLVTTNEIVKKILDIDLNNTTCIEAFNLLYSVQNDFKNIYK